MKRYTYGERDYAFGQLVLTLRTTIGLSQAALGELLGVSRRAVAEWEGPQLPKGGTPQTAHYPGHASKPLPPGARRRRSACCGRRRTRSAVG